MQARDASGSGELRELAAVFLRLGTLAFGGPAAHIAMMDEEVVQRRGWLTRQRFLDLLGAAHLIPGPNSTELAIHIGYERAGWRGLLVAGACFIGPAVAVVWLLAAAYVRYRTLPQVEALLYGVKPVVMAVVVQALWRLGRSAVRDARTALAAAASLALAAAGVHELLVLALAGVGLLLARQAGRPAAGLGMLIPAPVLAQAGQGTQAAAAAVLAAGPVLPLTLTRLFWFFVKVGAVLYGSGYVLLAFLQADLVDRWGWLTQRELLDAVAVGQVTPGPVFTTATFVGYVVAGPAGAAAATLGIFLPAFAFVAASRPLLDRLRQSVAAGAFLDGVNAASLALMAVVTARLARAALVDAPTALLAAAAFAALLRWRVNSAWLILGGAAAGLLVR